MKFDMGEAWTTATGLLSKNKDVILVVAGVFFFLPYVASTLLFPQAMTPEQVNPEDLSAVSDAVLQAYADYWWVILIVFVTQGIGTLSLLTLLTDRAKPTVGEAIARGASGFLSYFAANLIFVFALGTILTIALLITPFLVVLAIPVMFYAMVKFSLVMPAIAIDGIRNPIKAISRSWSLTKGNSFRLFAFYVLLVIALMVVTLIITMVLAVLLAAIGGQIETIGNALVASLINAGFVVLFLGILAGVHRQLAGDRPEELSEVFD